MVEKISPPVGFKPWTTRSVGQCLTPELQIRGGIEDNSKIIFLISQQKHML